MFFHGASSLMIGGCFLYLDMLRPDTYTVTGGTTVTSLNNRVSGTAWNTSVTAFPLYDGTGLNGRPCMVGDGARGLLSTEALVVAALTGADKPHTIFLVTEPVTLAPAGYRASIAWANSGVANRVAYMGRQGGTGRYRHELLDDAASNAAVTRSVDVALSPQIVCYRTTGTASSIFVGTEATPDPNGGALNRGTITPDRVALFCIPDSAPDTFSSDKIGAVLGYDRELSNLQTRAVINTLRAQWGL